MKFPKKIVQLAFSAYAKRLAKTQMRKKHFANYSQIKSVLLLYENNLSGNDDTIHQIISELTRDGKTVTTYGFAHKAKEFTNWGKQISTLGLESTNCLLRPPKYLLKNLEKEPFDLAIDLTTREVVPTDYLFVTANARCKVSRSRTSEAAGDLMIDITNAEQNASPSNYKRERYLFDQIVFYLRQISEK